MTGNQTKSYPKKVYKNKLKHLIYFTIIKQKIKESGIFSGYLLVDISLKALSYIMIPFYLWNIPRSVYGDLNNVIAYVIQVSQLIGVFCGTHACFLLTEPNKNKKASDEFGSALFLLVTFIFFAIPVIMVFSPTLFIEMYVNSGVCISKTVIILFPFIVFGMAVNQIIQTITILLNDKGRLVKNNVYRTLLTIFAGVLTVLLSKSEEIIENRLIGGGVLELILLSIGLIWVKKTIPKWSIKLEKVFDLIKYGAVNIFSSGLFFFIICFERAAVTKYRNGELIPEYNLIIQLISPINIIAASLIGFWSGDLREHIADGLISHRGIKFIKLSLLRNLFILFVLNVLIICLYLVLKKYSIIPPHYKIEILQIAVFGGSAVVYNIMNMINITLGFVYRIKKTIFHLFIIIIATSCLKFYIIKNYGLIGVALGSLFENIIILGFLSVNLRKHQIT